MLRWSPDELPHEVVVVGDAGASVVVEDVDAAFVVECDEGASVVAGEGDVVVPEDPQPARLSASPAATTIAQ